jgi:hypothetical protein
MYATTTRNTTAKKAVKRTKNENLEEHSGWLIATAPMRRPGLLSSGVPLAAPAREGIGGFGEVVFRVWQSDAMLVASSAETARSHLRVVRLIALYTMRCDGFDACCELGDHISEVVFRRRGSVAIFSEG